MAGDENIYGFDPSEAASVIVVILFGFSTIYHCYQAWKYRARFFVVFIIGGARRIVVLVEKPQLSLIAPHRVTKLFVLGDVIAFIAQLAGGGTMASDGSQELGERVLIAGLVVQLLSFGFFTTAFVFEMRLQKLMLFRERTLWRILLYILFVAAGLIIARCIYRLIEAGQGVHGYLASHEAYFYVFDALPMFVVQVIFHFCPAGKALGSPSKPAKGTYEATNR